MATLLLMLLLSMGSGCARAGFSSTDDAGAADVALGENGLPLWDATSTSDGTRLDSQGTGEDAFVNRPPTITANCITLAEVDIAYGCALTADDPDGDALVWSLHSSSSCSWLSLDSSQAMVRGRPTNGDIGSCKLVFEVQDRHGAGDGPVSFTIEVRPPTALVETRLFYRASAQTALCSGEAAPSALITEEVANTICTEDLGPSYRVSHHLEGANVEAYQAALERPPTYTGSAAPQGYVFAIVTTWGEGSYYGHVPSAAGNFARSGTCAANDQPVPILCRKGIKVPTMLGAESTAGSRPTIAFDAVNNRYAVVWLGATDELTFRVIDGATGDPIAPATTIAGASMAGASLAFDSQSGNYLVAWGAVGGKRAASVIGSDGNMLVGEIVLAPLFYDNAPGTGTAVLPKSQEGGFLVAYAGRYTLEENDLGGVYARSFDGLGNPTSAELLISNTSAQYGLGGSTAQIDLVYHPDLDSYGLAYSFSAGTVLQVETLVVPASTMLPQSPQVYAFGKFDGPFRLVPRHLAGDNGFTLLFGKGREDVYLRQLSRDARDFAGSVDLQLNDGPVAGVANLHGFLFGEEARYPFPLRGKFFVGWASAYQYLNGDGTRTPNSVPDRLVTSYPKDFEGVTSWSASALNRETGGLAHVGVENGQVVVQLRLPDGSLL